MKNDLLWDRSPVPSCFCLIQGQILEYLIDYTSILSIAVILYFWLNISLHDLVGILSEIRFNISF